MKKLPLIAMLIISFFILDSCENSINIIDEIRSLVIGPLGQFQIRQEATEILAGGIVTFENTPNNATRTLFFTIRNTGTGEIKLIGENEVDITPTGTTPTGIFTATMPDSVIAPGSSVVFSITFDPASVASYTASVSIKTDMESMPSFAFNLEGTGTAVDLTPPSGTISINSGASSTNSLIVNLTMTQNDGLGGSGVTHVKISNEASFSGDWMTYSNSFTNWSMSPGTDGARLVYAKFRDAAGNESGAVSDGINYETVLPTVFTTLPLNNATNVLRNSNIDVDFSEAMNSSTITSSTFILYRGGTAINSNLSAPSATKYRLTPTTYLTPGGIYTVKVFPTVKDSAGNSLGTAYTWTFTVQPDDVYEGSWGNDEWDYSYELWTTSSGYNGVDDPYGYFGSQAYESYGTLWNEDWYKIFVAPGDRPVVTASYRIGSTGANISMQIRDEDDNIITNGDDDPATASANDEVSIWWEPHAVSPGEYFYIRIYSSSAYSGRAYDLRWEDCGDCGL